VADEGEAVRGGSTLAYSNRFVACVLVDGRVKKELAKLDLDKLMQESLEKAEMVKF